MPEYAWLEDPARGYRDSHCVAGMSLRGIQGTWRARVRARLEQSFCGRRENFYTKDVTLE